MVANLNRRALEIAETVEANCHALSDPGNAAAWSRSATLSASHTLTVRAPAFPFLVVLLPCMFVGLDADLPRIGMHFGNDSAGVPMLEILPLDV
jgi:hypothetical protein